MRKKYSKYAVYFVEEADNVENGGSWDEVSRQFVGYTFAVSEKAAINNVRYRNVGKGYNGWLEDLGTQTYDRHYEAVLADD